MCFRGALTEIHSDNKYTFAQINELTEGLCAGVDILTYANPDFSVEHMHRVKCKLIHNKLKEISDINTELDFTEEQEYLIVSGYEHGIDYKAYAKPEYSPRKMKAIQIELILSGGTE